MDDNRRLCEFVYRNLGSITQVVPSLDTHHAMQIFHAAWLIDADGKRPEPMTLVTAQDAAEGRWRVDPEVARAAGVDPAYAQRHLEHYTHQLAERGKYDLTVWPYHAMLGGIGHALVSAVEEAVFFHGLARRSAPRFCVKGELALTEHYSMLGPEVTEGPDGEPIASTDHALVETLLGFDAVIVAGQAKSHCLAWTIDDLLAHRSVQEQQLAQRTYLLEDCTSPIVVPGVVDYTARPTRRSSAFPRRACTWCAPRTRSRRGRASPRARSEVAQHVDHPAGRLAHEEPAHAPGFIGQRVEDREAPAEHLGVDGIHVVHLDRHVGRDRGAGVVGHHADLDVAVAGVGVGDDPAQVHRHLEAEHVDVELARGLRIAGVQVGHDAADAHAVEFAKFLYSARCGS